MHLDERNEGDYRIYAGALEAPQGDGYVAAVVVNRLRANVKGMREAYRDTSMSGGHRWASPSDALRYAWRARTCHSHRASPARMLSGMIVMRHATVISIVLLSVLASAFAAAAQAGLAR